MTNMCTSDALYDVPFGNVVERTCPLVPTSHGVETETRGPETWSDLEPRMVSAG